MTLDETAQPLSLVGPARYDLWILVPGKDDIGFVVNGLALPRVGDDLAFEGSAGNLNVTVTKVDHTFWSAEVEEVPRRTISITAAPWPASSELVEKLRDESELEKWFAGFPMLEPL